MSGRPSKGTGRGSASAKRGTPTPAKRGAGTGSTGGRAQRARTQRGPVIRFDAPKPPPPRTLRVGFIPGVEPDRFARRWSAGERRDLLELVPVPLSRQVAELLEGTCDMCFVRLPLDTAAASALHVVELWEERASVVAGDESFLSLLDEIREEDLAEETEIPAQHVDDAADRVAVAATGAGYTRMPLSLARLHHRKDAVHRPIVDAPPTRIALAWPRDADDALRQEFVGVVRGRTARSSRSSDDPDG